MSAMIGMRATGAAGGRLARMRQVQDCRSAIRESHQIAVPAASSGISTSRNSPSPGISGATDAWTGIRAARPMSRAARAASSAQPFTAPQEPDPVEPGVRAVMKIAITALAIIFLSQAMGSTGKFAVISMADTPGRTEAMLATARSAWAGLAAGCLHTLAGPDHLAALAPLTIGRSRAASATLGALWGGGHSTGQLLIGLVFILFKDQVQGLIPILSRCGTTLVGITLILIGIVGIKESKELAKEDAAGSIEKMEGLEDGKGRYGLATYATGIIYGLQPDALFVIIPALALPTKAAAAAFVLTFVFGTVAAMSSYTAFIGTVCQKLGERIPSVTERLAVGAAAVAICLGLAFLLVAAGVPVPFLS